MTKTSGITGYKVITYRNRFAADGTVISSEEEDVSIYSKRDQVILVAPGELELYAPDAKPAEPSPTPVTTPPPASDSDIG